MAQNDRWTEQQLAEYLARFQAKTHSRAPVRPTDVECDPGHEATAKDGNKEVHPRFRIHIHSRRRRLTDSDGIYCKAAVDGLTAGGIFRNDSLAYIESVTFSQEKAEIEQTVIELWEIDDGLR